MKTSRFYGMRWLTDEFDYRLSQLPEREGEYGIAEILRIPAYEIGIGDPNSASSELPGLVRQIYQDSDWHFVSSTLLKKLSAEDLAERGEWGQDWMEGDLHHVLEQLKDSPKAMQWLQERIGNDIEIALEEGDTGLLIDMFLGPSDTDAMAYADTGLDESSEDDENEEDREDDTLALNSPYTGLGFRPPRDRYQVVERFRINPMKEAKDRRETYLINTVREIQDLGTSAQHLHTNASDPLSEWEMFMTRIRQNYIDDKEIILSWGETERVKYRALYEISLRKQNLDEETIRVELWKGFDRKAGELFRLLGPDGTFLKVIGYRPTREQQKQTGNTISFLMKTRPSTWDIARSREMIDLVLTQDQWKILYRYAWEKLFRILFGMGNKAESTQEKERVMFGLAKYGKRFTKDQIRDISDVLFKKYDPAPRTLEWWGLEPWSEKDEDEVEDAQTV